MTERSNTRRRPAEHARLLKGMGFVGYGALMVTLVLVAAAVGSAAGGHSAAIWWTVAAVLVAIVAVALLFVSRYISARQPGDTRIQQDPLQPEVTAEEEEHYEEMYRGDDDTGHTR
ncbi:hypothetical protein VZC37_16520 [Gordonia sp. LSe1-13]|uniref:Uncharacterized protein n=1 Tax=Gordonia sesuvii TaxID=3116777 RepID=A0ABU7MGH6_9ACTN|nr:hypothetical protein [Gordonia sp. LSe1-13]